MFSKLNQISTKILLALVFFLLAFIVFLIRIRQTPSQIKASWWNPSWTYRQAVNIGWTGSELTDFQVSFDIGTSALINEGKMNSDCSDIRLTDSDGNSIPYWIEKLSASACNTNNTKIWTKTSSILSTGTTIYLYYGNSSATSTESGPDTFEYFDDFDDDSLNPSLWTKVDSISEINETDGKLVFTGGTSGSWNQAVYLNDSISRGDYAMEFDYQWTSNNPSFDAFMFGWKDDGAGIYYGNLVYGYYNVSANDCTTCNISIYEDSTQRSGFTGTWTQNTNYKTQVRMKSAGGAYYKQSSDGGITWSTSYDSSYSTESTLHPAWMLYSGTHNIDNFFIRKSVPTEPSSSLLESEESRPSAQIGVGSSQITPINKKLVAYYKFDEGFGTTTADWSGNNLHGVLGSSSARPVWKSGDECISGKCLEFDGVDDYVEIANDPALNFGTGVFTISTWIKILPNDIDSDWHNVISKKTGYNNTDIGWMAWLDFRYPGSLSLRVNDGSNVNDDTPTSQYSLKSTIQDGNFHHISWVVNSNDTVTFYLDGIAQDSRSFSKSGSLDNSLPLQIGTQGSSKGVNAIQDEVKIYNYALSEDEIKQDFNQGSAVVFGSTNQTIGGTTTSLEYCIPGDTTYCAPPIAQWNFEEGTGTTAYDTSGSANHGSFGSGSSAPSWTTGKVGKALSFDGIDDHTKTGGVFTSLGTSNTPYSFTGWFKANSGETDGNIIHMSSLATGGAGWCLPPVALDAGKLTAFSWNGGLVTATGATTVQANTWYHFGITWDSTNGLRVFLNGRLDGSQSQTNYSASGSSNYIFLGFTPNQCSGNQGWFNGSVDQVKIYNYARTPAQIAYDYNRGAPVAWWKLDEDSGTQAADWSGNGLHGTLGSGSSAPTWLSGKFNNALSFDGNDYIDLGTPTSLNITQQISISAWIKRSALGGSDSIICKRLTTGNIQYCLRMFPDNKAYIGTYNGSSWTRAFSTSELISTTDWYHVLGTYDKSNFKIYINGVLENTQSYSSDLNNTSGKTSIGKMGEQNSDFFNGLIDDVRIYNYALTDTQIKTLYNNGAVSFN